MKKLNLQNAFNDFFFTEDINAIFFVEKICKSH